MQADVVLDFSLGLRPRPRLLRSRRPRRASHRPNPCLLLLLRLQWQRSRLPFSPRRPFSLRPPLQGQDAGQAYVADVPLANQRSARILCDGRLRRPILAVNSLALPVSDPLHDPNIRPVPLFDMLDEERRAFWRYQVKGQFKRAGVGRPMHALAQELQPFIDSDYDDFDRSVV